MYIPHYYKNNNIEEVKNFINENSFGILISQSNNRLSGTHIPMILDTDKNGNDILIGHISKANPQLNNLKDDDEVLAIFNGPNTYISSSWYQNENVPTWNYIAVHIYGKVKRIKGKELFYALNRMIGKFEQVSKNPIELDKMSDNTLKQINGIIGFYILINDIQAAYKLSQNRDEKDFQNIIQELNNIENPNSVAVANEMKKLKK